MPEWLRPVRMVLRRAPWQTLMRLRERTGPVIAELVGPLRLDVLVVRDFLRFYVDHQDLAADSFDAFVHAARDHRFWDLIYGWFSLYQPEAVRDPRVFGEHFAGQVRRSVMLWHELADGYDRQRPIEVKVAARVLPTHTGKIVHSRQGLGDGGHRAACLMLRGLRTLPAGVVRYTWFRRRRPYDGTWVLTHRRALGPTEYFGYLSEVYGSPDPLRTAAALRRFVAAAAPARLRELESVIRGDGYDG
ncbi:MAG: hypothetical protein QN159_02845 [Armatimonadota bacterium]|nr:hypothetical protein [Armatimonadota bacterium]